MKFGSSLLGSKEGISRVATLIQNESKKGGVVAVLSALGGVTDSLLDAASTAKRGDASGVATFIRELRELHFKSVEDLNLDAARKVSLQEQIDNLLGKLKVYLLGVSYVCELTPRTLDLILSFGEQFSVLLLASFLNARGANVQALSGGEAGIVTDESFGEAIPILERTKLAVRSRLLPLLDRGVTPLVTGFVAQSISGEITTLGRGGSDYTATIIGYAIDASEVILWTDVEGMLTADPRIVKEARVIDELSYAEAEEMTRIGAKKDAASSPWSR